ncbi:MAG TPA: hypothetical protein VL173_08845 [Vicinamibacterales bacterium]|nr:hypothetical protein [Vicinamibacterales bacterium]
MSSADDSLMNLPLVVPCAPLDPVAFGGTAMLFTAVTLLACYVPTRRATLVDPAEALRQAQ